MLLLFIVIVALIALLIAPLAVFYGTRIVRRFGCGESGNEKRT
jgi:hypothetical protein